MWCPPTPPQQSTDVYVDHSISFLYNTDVMMENELPAVYIRKDKRTRFEAGLVDSKRSPKMARKEETFMAPRSLFHSAHILKMRREKYRGLMARPMMIGRPIAKNPVPDVPVYVDWTIHEDMAILKAIQNLQGLPLNLINISPGLELELEIGVTHVFNLCSDFFMKIFTLEALELAAFVSS